MDDDIKDVDVYELLGIPSTADERQIKKSYRKKALLCHPDKNPDNPNAGLLFLQLSKALEILLDQAKRADYDKIYNAKKAAKIRHQNLDIKRKKFKEDLEIKEQLAHSFKTFEQTLAEKIARLRKEGSQQLKEEMETVSQQIVNENLLKTKLGQADDGNQFHIKIKWKSEKSDPTNGGYNFEKLTLIFSKYGNIGDLIISQNKKGSGLIVFKESDAALKAYKFERGYPENPLKLSWLNQVPLSCQTSAFQTDFASGNESNFTNYKMNKGLFPSADTSFNTSKGQRSSCPSSSLNYDNDYEAIVFAKLKEAEENKKKVIH